MERQLRPFSKQWKLVERAESFEVQDTRPAEREPVSISPTIRGAASSIRAPRPGRTQVSDRAPVIFTESDTHRPTPNVVTVGFIGAPSQWERFDKRLAKLQRHHGFSIFHSTELKSRRGDLPAGRTAQLVRWHLHGPPKTDQLSQAISTPNVGLWCARRAEKILATSMACRDR